ncbi:MAG: hypothetical protein ACI8XC_001665 [Gammaproteobacteria bacterium]|jgi:hypothetical protein
MSQTTFDIAQLNIAKMMFAIDDARMAEFFDNLDSVNALADTAPAFVWRLQTEEGGATAIDYFGSDILVTMSVWESVESRHQYIYRSAHNQIMAKRKKWFEHAGEVDLELWWIAKGHIPSIEEAGERLDALRANGPGPDAFTFKKHFPPS